MVNDTPKYVIWKGRSHNITQIGLHHYFRQGKTLYHVFSVVTSTLFTTKAEAHTHVSGECFMRLKLDTDSLIWKLEEISEEFTI